MTPLGLTRKTLPLAVRLPRIADGSWPITRLRATDVLLGWTKATDSPAPIPKDCQLIATLALDWSIVRPAAVFEKLAAPAVTAPPIGSA